MAEEFIWERLNCFLCAKFPVYYIGFPSGRDQTLDTYNYYKDHLVSGHNVTTNLEQIILFSFQKQVSQYFTSQANQTEIKKVSNGCQVDQMDLYANEPLCNPEERYKVVKEEEESPKTFTDVKPVIHDDDEEELHNQNNNLGDLEGRVKQNEDQIKHIDDTLDGLHKTVAIFEGRHVETVEKMKEDTILANNIQDQLKEQDQKIMEARTVQQYPMKKQRTGTTKWKEKGIANVAAELTK